MLTLVLLIASLPVFNPPVHAAGNVYYVAENGNDSNTGSQSSPFKTIKKAADKVKAGDTVLVKPGTYMERSIIPSSSGTEDNMIVFRPVTKGTVTIRHPETQFVDDSSNANLTTSVFDLSGRNYIQIEGFSFKNYAYAKASVKINGTGNVVINNRFEGLGNNRVNNGNSTAVVYVEGSHNVIRNNYFNDIYGDGVSTKANANNNLVTDNSYLNFKGKPRGWAPTGSFSSAMGGEDPKETYPALNNIFSFNYSKDIKKQIWFDRGASGNIILRNEAYSGELLFFNESRSSDNLVQENVASGMTSSGFETAQYDTGSTFDTRWINNVVYNSKAGFKIDKSFRDELRNNISYNNTESNLSFTLTASGDQPREIDMKASQNNVGGYRGGGPHVFLNNMWSSDKGNNAATPILYKNDRISVGMFRAAVSELGGVDGNPLFTDPAAGNFTLKDGSPAIGASDTGLDIGAYAIYPKIPVGYDENMALLEGVTVGFRYIISTLKKGTPLSVEIILNKAPTSAVSVNLVPVAGDAQIGKDLSVSAQTVKFAAGERKKTITIGMVDNASAKYDQLITFRLEHPSGAQVGPKNTHTIRVVRDESVLPTMVSVDDVNISTKFGVKPTLPKTLEVTMSDGTKRVSDVTWDDFSEKMLALDSFTVSGILAGDGRDNRKPELANTGDSNYTSPQNRKVKAVANVSFVQTSPDFYAVLVKTDNYDNSFVEYTIRNLTKSSKTATLKIEFLNASGSVIQTATTTTNITLPALASPPKDVSGKVDVVVPEGLDIDKVTARVSLWSGTKEIADSVIFRLRHPDLTRGLENWALKSKGASIVASAPGNSPNSTVPEVLIDGNRQRGASNAGRYQFSSGSLPADIVITLQEMKAVSVVDVIGLLPDINENGSRNDYVDVTMGATSNLQLQNIKVEWLDGEEWKLFGEIGSNNLAWLRFSVEDPVVTDKIKINYLKGSGSGDPRTLEIQVWADAPLIHAEAPTITGQPQDQTVSMGSNSPTLSVAAR
ncbi:DUF1565 domain-containing protein [Paenibacillus pasadenensis]